MLQRSKRSQRTFRPVKFEDLLSQIRHKQFAPVYFLEGDEAFFIDEIFNALEEEAMLPAERDFNQTILYGKDTDVLTIIAEARRFPMMAERVLVLVREAQHLKKEQLEKLEAYVEHPNSQTVLAFAFKGKKLDKRLKLAKLIKSKGVLFESKPLYDNQLPHWIEAHAKSMGIRIDGMAVRMMAEYLGSDLGRIHSELRKLRIVLPEGQMVSSDLVAEQVGIHKDYNVFELTKALSLGDRRKVVQIAQYAAANPKEMPAVMMLAMLTTYFERIIRLQTMNSQSAKNPAAVLGVNPMFVSEYEKAAQRYPLKQSVKAMELLYRADQKVKGVGAGTTDNQEWMRELFLQLIHIQKVR